MRVRDAKVKGSRGVREVAGRPRREVDSVKPGPVGLVAAAAVVCCAAAWLLAGRDLGEPGLYYDELIQVGPSLEFLRENGEPPRIPGVRAARVFGRWLPWMTQPYMGALKSQLLIPVFAIGEPDAGLLRGTTLMWTLLGLPLVMLFANRLLGVGVALLTGALLAVDPSLLFLARHDWGSFGLGFLLRCASLLLIAAGWRSGSRPAIAAGGACLGLGVYNKIDFGVFIAAAGFALLISAPGELRRALTERRDRLLAFGAGFALGVAPLVLALPGALSVAGAAARDGLGGMGSEKWMVLRSVLDGSYFQRLIEVGGRFDALAAAESTRGFGFEIFIAGVIAIVAVQVIRGLRGPDDRAVRFVLLTALLTFVGILFTPRAVRAHHFLNAWPFPQLVVASAVVLIWTRASRIAAVPAYGVALLLFVAALVSALRMDVATLDLLRDSGGRGRWSHAVEELARELPASARVVSVDWGFDGPLRFAAPELRAEEPIWRLRAGALPIGRGGRSVELAGSPDHVYLVYEPEYAVFPFGQALLEAVARLPVGAAAVARHADREGAPVFRTIRFAAPHNLVYRGGRFEVELR